MIIKSDWVWIRSARIRPGSGTFGHSARRFALPGRYSVAKLFNPITLFGSYGCANSCSQHDIVFLLFTIMLVSLSLSLRSIQFCCVTGFISCKRYFQCYGTCNTLSSVYEHWNQNGRYCKSWCTTIFDDVISRKGILQWLFLLKFWRYF